MDDLRIVRTNNVQPSARLTRLNLQEMVLSEERYQRHECQALLGPYLRIGGLTHLRLERLKRSKWDPDTDPWGEKWKTQICKSRPQQSNSLTSASARKKVGDDDIVKVEAEADKSVAEVNALFAKVDDRRQKREVPNYVFGKISFDPMTRTKLT